MSQNPTIYQHKRGPSSVLLKLLDHVSLMSINTPGTTTSFSFKCSNPEFASFGLCQWFAFTSKILYIQPDWASDPSSLTNSNQCDVPSSESSRKCWVCCTICFCTSRLTRPKCNNTSKIHSPPSFQLNRLLSKLQWPEKRSRSQGCHPCGPWGPPWGPWGPPCGPWGPPWGPGGPPWGPWGPPWGGGRRCGPGPPRKDFNFSPSTAAPTPPAISVVALAPSRASGFKFFTASSSGFASKSCKWFSSSSPFADFSAISGVVEDSDAGSKTSPCTVSASTNEISSFMGANGQAQKHGA